MDFDELFEQNNKHDRYKKYQYSNLKHSDHSKNYNNDFKFILLNKLKNNPKLKFIFIISIIILIIIVVFLVILLFPFLMKFLTFIKENGIQGLIDSIWNGVK